MKRKKNHPRPPPNATAWCALHERLMNDYYIHRKRCCLRGHYGPCKHLLWLNQSTPLKREDN